MPTVEVKTAKNQKVDIDQVNFTGKDITVFFLFGKQIYFLKISLSYVLEGSMEKIDFISGTSEKVLNEKLKTLLGTVAAQQVTILKDDRCNDNVIYTTL